MIKNPNFFLIIIWAKYSFQFHSSRMVASLTYSPSMISSLDKRSSRKSSTSVMKDCGSKPTDWKSFSSLASPLFVFVHLDDLIANFVFTRLAIGGHDASHPLVNCSLGDANLTRNWGQCPRVPHGRQVITGAARCGHRTTSFDSRCRLGGQHFGWRIGLRAGAVNLRFWMAFKQWNKKPFIKSWPANATQTTRSDTTSSGTVGFCHGFTQSRCNLTTSPKFKYGKQWGFILSYHPPYHRCLWGFGTLIAPQKNEIYLYVTS